jgi:hypothetical protein
VLFLFHFQPLIQAQKITSSDYQSYWVKQSQMWLSELVGPDSTKINVGAWLYPLFRVI